MKKLPHSGFGEPADPDQAMRDIGIDLPGYRAGRKLSDDHAQICLRRLLSSTVGIAAINGFVGYCNGSAASLSELLAANHLTDGPGSLAGVFAACFIVRSAAAEVADRLVRRRHHQFLQQAPAWPEVEAILDSGRGIWVVGKGDLDLPESKWLITGHIILKNEVSVLSEAEFARLEQQIAQAGGTLKKYRTDQHGYATITTEVGGKLHSLKGDPAVECLNDGFLLRSEWYDQGRRIAPPGQSLKDDPRYAETVQHWLLRQHPPAMAAILRLVLDDLRHVASQLQRDDILQDPARTLIRHGQELVLQIDTLLSQLFGPDFELLKRLGSDVDNLDGMMQWPAKTAGEFRVTALIHLENTIDDIDERVLAIETPHMLEAQFSLQDALNELDKNAFRAWLRRLPDGQPSLVVSSSEDGKLMAVVVTAQDGYAATIHDADINHRLKVATVSSQWSAVAEKIATAAGYDPDAFAAAAISLA